MKNMHANMATKSGGREPRSFSALSRAIGWLQSYVDKEPYTEAATEARSIIYELKAVRPRAGVDELLALIAQIAQTDQGLQEIQRAKIRMGQPEQKTGREKAEKET